MPAVNLAARHKFNRDPIVDPIVFLLEFNEDGSSDYVRLAANNEDVIFEGNTFTRCAIQVTPPSSGNGDATASLEISNVDRVVGRALDAASRRINCRMIVVDTSDTSQALIDTKNLMVIPSASGDTTRITAQLGARAEQLEPIPFKRTTQSEFPGLWLA